MFDFFNRNNGKVININVSGGVDSYLGKHRT